LHGQLCSSHCRRTASDLPMAIGAPASSGDGHPPGVEAGGTGGLPISAPWDGPGHLAGVLPAPHTPHDVCLLSSTGRLHSPALPGTRGVGPVAPLALDPPERTILCNSAGSTSWLKNVLSASPPDPLSAHGARVRLEPWRRGETRTWGVGGARLPPPPRRIHPFPCGTRVSRGCRLMQGSGLRRGLDERTFFISSLLRWPDDLANELDCLLGSVFAADRFSKECRACPKAGGVERSIQRLTEG
jgi:hypothetical protein